MKKACIVFLVLLLVTGTAAFAGGKQEAKEVRIGIIGPISGEAATYGESTVNSAKLYFDQINAAGGIDGLKIKYFIEDDKGDPTEGANAYSKLIDQNKVSLIYGSVISKVCLAGAPIAQNKGIPMISSSATNPAVTLVGDYIFRACFIDPFQGTIAAKFASGELKKTTAAVLYDAGNDYTKGLAEVFRAEFTKIGGKITAFESYAAGTSDFNAQLVKIKATKPEVLFLPNFYNDVGLIAKQARDMGIDSVFIGGDGWDSPDLFKIGGKAVEGGYFVNHFSKDSDSPGGEEVHQRLQGQVQQGARRVRGPLLRSLHDHRRLHQAGQGRGAEGDPGRHEGDQPRDPHRRHQVRREPQPREGRGHPRDQGRHHGLQGLRETVIVRSVPSSRLKDESLSAFPFSWMAR